MRVGDFLFSLFVYLVFLGVVLLLFFASLAIVITSGMWLWSMMGL